jgi:hypothetical protein
MNLTEFAEKHLPHIGKKMKAHKDVQKHKTTNDLHKAAVLNLAEATALDNKLTSLGKLGDKDALALKPIDKPVDPPKADVAPSKPDFKPDVKAAPQPSLFPDPSFHRDEVVTDKVAVTEEKKFPM